MKTIIILLSLLFCNSIESQTLKETQDWIKEKIELHSYSNEGDIMYKYNITFMGSVLILNERLETFIGGVKNNLSDTYAVPIKQLTKIRFEEKENNVWMFIKIKSGQNQIRKSSLYATDSNKTKNLSQFAIMLEKTIKSNDLEKRLTKAFNHLVKLNGGIVVNEKF